MAREPNNLRLASPLETEPSFTLTFRGYNKREVDQYAQITETQLSAAVAERNELAATVRTLTDQLHHAHSELVDLRRRPSVDDKLSFRHLGPRVACSPACRRILDDWAVASPTSLRAST